MLPSEWQVAQRGLHAGLYGSDALAELDKIAAGNSTPNSEAEAAQLLVQHGLVTRYQAKLLVRGVSNGFFLGPYKLLTPIKENEFCRYYGAENRETGEKNILCVLRPDQPDPALANEFVEKVRARQLPEMPAGQPTKICRFGQTQVAVLAPPASVSEAAIQPKKVKKREAASSGDTMVAMNSQPTEDDLPSLDLPAVDMGLAAADTDISSLLEDDPAPPPASVRELPANVAEDEPIVDEPEMGTLPTTGYELKRPKKRARKKQWRPSPRAIVGTLAVVIFVVLVFVLRTQVLGL